MLSCFPLRCITSTAQRGLTALEKIMSLYFSIFGEGVGLWPVSDFWFATEMIAR